MFHGNCQLKKIKRKRKFQTQTGFSIKELVGENYSIKNKR